MVVLVTVTSTIGAVKDIRLVFDDVNDTGTNHQKNGTKTGLRMINEHGKHGNPQSVT